MREVAKALRIEHLLDKRPSALSGGDMQRVAIGRALVRRPKALLMDEPMGALDAKLREEMRAELKHIHIENEATTVYVTHDQVEAMAMADRIAIMNDGVLQQVGLPADVYRASRQPVRGAVRRQPDHERRERQRSAPATAARPWCWARTMRFSASPSSSTTKWPKGRPKGARRGRARHRHSSRGGAGRAPAATDGYFPAEAHIIERLGPYDIVDLKFGTQLFRARTASGYVKKAGRRGMGSPRRKADPLLRRRTR